ncbi:MAG: hypothetical protein R2698_08290 [Microthrixaceae bacterium]
MPRRNRPIAVLAVFVALVVGVAACGDDSTPRSTASSRPTTSRPTSAPTTVDAVSTSTTLGTPTTRPLTAVEAALAGVLYIDSCGSPVREPGHLVVACGDGSAALPGLRWSMWGAEGAWSAG